MNSDDTDKELTKLHRIFRLIELMSRKPHRTTQQYAEQLGVGRKSIERYYHLLEKVGYLIDKDSRHRYFVHVESGLEKDIAFEEAAYLNDLLQQLPDDSPLRTSLLLKVNKQFQLHPVIQTMHRSADFRKVQLLRKALEENKVVRIYNYAGGNGTVTTRRVVITDFTESFKAILAFDLDKNVPRQFHVDRMGTIEVTAEEANSDQTFSPNDLFGWPGAEWFTVYLLLSSRAHQLLTEEFPLSRTMVRRRTNGTIVAELQIRGLPACARWVRGLPSDVEVLPGGVGEDLKGILNEGRRKW
jgi:predicted DNA-binding transcriptional regulator YafY